MEIFVLAATSSPSSPQTGHIHHNNSHREHRNGGAETWLCLWGTIVQDTANVVQDITGRPLETLERVAVTSKVAVVIVHVGVNGLV